MAGFLQNTEHHYLDQRPDMQTVRRAIKSDIGRYAAFTRHLVEIVNIRGLMHVATFGNDIDKIRLVAHIASGLLDGKMLEVMPGLIVCLFNHIRFCRAEEITYGIC